MITIRELAKLCGVSTAAISYVLNDKDKGQVSAATRARILKVARKHDYRWNLMARGLVERRTYRIGVVIRGDLSGHAIIGEFSLYDRLGLLARKLHATGYALELLQIALGQSAAKVSAEITSAPVDGFVFLDWPAKLLADLLKPFQNAGRPAVSLGTVLGPSPVPWVDVDREAAIRDAVRRFISLGHEKIALLQTPVGRRFIELKQSAFEAAVEAELNVNGAEWVHATAHDSHSAFVKVTEQVRRERKDVRAFLLPDNFYAEAVLDTLRNTGLEPGRDCRVTGFGDTALADRCSPRLSHYSLQPKQQVDFALAALQSWIRAPAEFTPSHKLLPPEFIERET